MHNWLAHEQEYCSEILEGIVRASFNAAGGYKFLGKLPKPAPLDGVYEFESEKIGTEVKNVREWIYPMSGEVWIMVKKCLTLDAIPFLVSRKTSHQARNVLTELGIMYFDVFRQVFSQRVSHLPPDIQHTDKLGYKDVLAVPIVANPHLVNYLQNTLPQQIASHRIQWDEKQDLLRKFAIDRDLGNPKVKDATRSEHSADLIHELFYGEDDAGEEEEFPDGEPEDFP